MTCNKCGKEIEDGAKLCAECESELKKEEKTGEDVAAMAAAVASEAYEETKQIAKEVGQSAKDLAEKGIDSYKNFKNMSKEEQQEAIEQTKEKAKTVAADVGRGAKDLAEKGIEGYKDFKNMSKEEQQEAVEQTKEKAKGFVKKEKENYKGFKALTTKQKLIRIAVPVLLLIIAVNILGGTGGRADVERDSRNDCYYFDITYDKFCDEMVSAISDVSGASKSEVKKYCKSLTPYNDSCGYCGNDALNYTIEVEYGTYVSTLKIEVYVEPKTNKVIYAEVFKANGGSSSESFTELANRASEVLCGKKVTKLDNHATDVKSEGGNNITHIEYKDYKLKLTEGTGSYTTGDMKKLRISCLDAE